MPAAAHTMQCMEVWGGNSGTDSAVATPGLDAWVYNRPFAGSAGGGDVYYVSSCATGRITRILLADVAGHGAHVASVADSLRTLMRRHVNYVRMTRVAQMLNREFTALAEAGRFATAVIGTYWGPTREMTLCNAGHPRPLRYLASQRTWQAVETPDSHARRGGADDLMNIPLGIAEPTGYAQFGFRLAEGDRLLLYTDSLIEAADPHGRRLGERGLADMVASIDHADAQTLIPALLSRLHDFRGGADPDDDVTILLLAPNAAAHRLSPADYIRIAGAYAKRAGEIGRGRFPWPEWSVRNIGGAFVERLNSSNRDRTDSRRGSQ